jgi:hypothetical protein
LIFTGQNKKDSIEVLVIDENVWMTQELIAELFGKGRSTIAEHVRNILKEELDENSVCRKFRRTATDGKAYTTKYSLEMIIAVGFRTNSERAIQFRNWAGKVLKDYSIRGYVLSNHEIWTVRFLFDPNFFALKSYIVYTNFVTLPKNA